MEKFIEKNKLKKLILTLTSELICFFITRINLIKYDKFGNTDIFLFFMKQISFKTSYMYDR